MTDISRGVFLYSESRYFDAHVFFEELWKTAEEDRLFLQGMIQISVGAYHLTKGSRKPAIGQYRKAFEKVKEYVPQFYGLNIEKLVLDLKEILRYLEDMEREMTEIVKYIPEIEVSS